MKKVLFVATITAHINGFHIPYVQLLKQQGYEVHVASNGDEEIQYCDKHYNISFTRKPFSLGNVKAYRSLKKIIQQNQYEIIHCHTPVGGALTRLAARKCKDTKIIYTAHGFHFYKGAPIKNWLTYYPIEKLLSNYTDELITINEEDYNLAKQKFKAPKVTLIHGVGVDADRFDFEIEEQEKRELLKELGVKQGDYIFLNIGELNINKNQIMQIEAINKLVKQHKNIKLLIAGEGPLKSHYKNVIKQYGLTDNVKIIGYRKDIPKLLKICNCVVATSKREGLPVNVIEAMLAKKDIIATKIRGHIDLVPEKKLVDLNNIEQLTQKMELAYVENNDVVEYETEKFTLRSIIEKMKEVYRYILN